MANNAKIGSSQIEMMNQLTLTHIKKKQTKKTALAKQNGQSGRLTSNIKDPELSTAAFLREQT